MFDHACGNDGTVDTSTPVVVVDPSLNKLASTNSISSRSRRARPKYMSPQKVDSKNEGNSSSEEVKWNWTNDKTNDQTSPPRKWKWSSQKDDARNEQDSTRGPSKRSVRRVQSSEGNSTNPSNSTGNSTSASPTTKSNNKIFGGDKRQKMVLYNEFSENPYHVLKGVVTDIPKPKSESDVVIKVEASTVSHRDCMIRRGISFKMIDPFHFPATPGCDVVGNIFEVGKNCKAFKVGDRVAALVQSGGNSRYISVPESDLVEVPRSCDCAEAVTMVSTYMAAYQSLRLVTNDNLSLAGKRVLVTGGIEPVGQALIQLCFRAGAETIYATAPENRHRYIKFILGANPLPLDPQKWLPDLKGTIDFVFDGTCQDNLDSPNAALKRGGTLVSMGMSALLNSEKPGLLGAPLSAYWAKLKRSMMWSTLSYDVWDSANYDKEAFKVDMEVLFHLLKTRVIKPHIAKRISLSEIAEAHANLQNESTRGQICVLPWKRTVS